LIFKPTSQFFFASAGGKNAAGIQKTIEKALEAIN